MKAKQSQQIFLIGMLFTFVTGIIVYVILFEPFVQASPQLQAVATRQSFMPVVSKASVDSFTLIDWDLGAGAITLDQASEYKVYALFGSSLLPSRYQSDIPIPMEGTDSLIFALQDWNELNA